MIDFTQVGVVSAIAIITYLIGYAAKKISSVKDDVIPVIVGASGGILGVVGMFVMPDFPAHDILNAIAIGIVSGLASTGANQVWKQAKK